MKNWVKSPLFMALLAVLLGALTGVTDVFDHGYWNTWNRLVSSPAPKDYLIVSIDEGAVSGGAGQAQQARALDQLSRSGAKRIFLDYPSRHDFADGQPDELRGAIAANARRVLLVRRARTQVEDANGKGEFPAAEVTFPTTAQIAASGWQVDFAGYFKSSPQKFVINGQTFPAVASLQTDGDQQSGGAIYPRYDFRANEIPVYAISDVVAGRIDARLFAGRTVFVTRTNINSDSVMGFFGNLRLPAAYADIAGLVGASSGKAHSFGSTPFLLLFVATILFGRRVNRKSLRLAAYVAFVATTLVAPYAFSSLRLLASPDWAMLAAFVYAPSRLWQKWRARVAMTNAASGLPNTEALAAFGIVPSQDVVAASISHYEQMMASLPRELHGECARQIARRLSVASGDSQIFDNDNGYFVWLTQPYSTDALVAQLEGLKALFAAPLVIEGRVLDTNIHFGLDRNAESKPISRIKSAIVGATEAQAKGKLYEEFGSKRLAETHWELSLHARIDEALRNGDIWLAFQGQYDFAANEVKGAETLIRWTDPERGVIPPDSFILQAERAGRIDAITYWVLEQAILASRTLDEQVGQIQLSVNLSAWMVDQPGMVQGIAEVIRRHSFDCSRLTLEVTETFSLSNRELAKRNLAELRGMGFRLSIDDFGTGQAGLAYLAEIPSDEIKLDRRFTQALLTSSRDRTIISNTVRLAHALGQEVVAEGVEDLATFEALRGLDCDIAQGYFVGRPVPFSEFVAELKSQMHVARGVVKAC